MYEACKKELDDFKTAIIDDELGPTIEHYKEDAGVQKSIAKTDFHNLMHAMIEKIHQLTDITDEEKQELKSKIIAKRGDFADDVLDWETKFNAAVE